MSDENQSAYYLDCKVVKETEKAINVEAPKGVFKEYEPGRRSRWAWIPKGALDEASELRAEGDEGRLVVANWFAEKEQWK